MARYTHEDRALRANDRYFLPSGDPFLPATSVTHGQQGYHNTTYRVALDHWLSDAVMAYVAYSTGFKSGGFNASPPRGPSFAPEYLDAIELGVKSSLLGGRARFNGAMFYYDYRDIQLARFVPGATMFYNGPDVLVRGMDLELDALLASGLTVTLGLSWLESEMRSGGAAIQRYEQMMPGGNAVTPVDPAGNELPFAPALTARIGLHYATQLGSYPLLLQGNYSYNDEFFWGPDNTWSEPSYGLLNISTTMDVTERVSVGVWGRNISNEFYRTATTYSAQTTASQLGAPRTFGVSANVAF